ncbi:MAG: TonB-dependent receptor plug domain-containing protein [Hyphomicrobium sp.]|nr:MAG: TonB-dependent receptor plug domain-containing protein [Hyphomicrobium sp.]MBZ0209335.1 TonB-dependent receptor plug domain-containing protein [Hyphomicrobium sp.]
MYRSSGAPLVCASVVAIVAVTASGQASAQENTAAPLPPVIVEQTAQPKKPVKKVAKKKSTAQEPSGAIGEDADADHAAMGHGAADIGVGAKGLAVPLNTTRLDQTAIRSQLPSTSDTAQIMSRAPGVSIFGAGGVSSLPAINGLNDDRVKILLNGMVVTSACSNHMNPPLSYIDPSQVVVADVIAGVTPVSKGGDSLGGTIIVESAVPQFADGDGVRTAGSISAFYHSNGDKIGTAATATAATRNVSIGYAGAWTKADNYERGDDGGEVRSTLYQASNHALTFAAKDADDLLIVQGTYAAIPYQGFVNQRMDMVDNEAWLLNARYVGRFDWGLLDARAFYHSTKHKMDILEDKQPGHMPMYTDGTDAGYSVKAEIPLSGVDLLRVGSEFHHQGLDDWWPPVPNKAPMMGPDTFWNINDGRRDRLGTFVEWEHRWDRAWSTLLGVRNDMVWMDTGDVVGYSMMYAADAAAFNAKDHSRTDANFDVTALARYEPSATEIYELGYARKTRSPNLYERYAWSSGNMAANMIGWYGDANGYIGNLDLEPEIANTVSVTTGWHDRAHREWALHVTPYYTYVEDYIDADFVATQSNANFVKLRFANHDARLYGVNVSGTTVLFESRESGRFDLSGVVGYVNGENLDTGDSLYHMMPLNARVALQHRLGGWSSALELVAASRKSDVNDLRNEPVTPGYALVNMRTSYEWENMRFDLGVDNLFDQLYYPPLGGVDWADYKAGGQMGRIGAVPGEGRSFNAGVTVKF